MKKIILGLLFMTLVGCATRETHQEKLSSIQIVDRNGFKETISSPERLDLYERADFLSPQPYEKVLRMYGRNIHGKTFSKLTTYHDNGEIWQYLETVNGRAAGIYREWHDNGVLRLDVVVIEGIGDLTEDAQRNWIFDGVSKVWDRQGNRVAEIYYDKGKLQGNAYFYHPNGKVSKVVPHENDRIDGEIIYYDEKEKMIGKTPYFKGKKEGITFFRGDRVQPAYSEQYQSGLLVQATYHDFSGKITHRIEKGAGKKPTYVDGVLLSVEEYRNGIPEGEVQVFNEQGHLQTLFHVKEGMKHGEEWVYYEYFGDKKPQPKLYIEWYEDTIQGLCRTWYSNGILESEREMMDNMKHGISSAWYKDGSLMLIEEYEHDRLCKGTYLKRGERVPVSSIENGEGTATLYDPDGVFMKRAVYVKGHPVDEL
ncbi:toxin-antitoxin system YwqK family antitoxin [Candidatus Neptunochlamydia vexilliferae]|uniref:toxin-antitoxin system YwqK family antitoxin n=1 Tax=Candidatus Neptunichlamydia vexilliferae TaxID=1651774 RepID=UPI001891D0B9|nr:hypothetical protein [Candidatus Neptunochlamydia vexilliferae]